MKKLFLLTTKSNISPISSRLRDGNWITKLKSQINKGLMNKKPTSRSGLDWFMEALLFFAFDDVVVSDQCHDKGADNHERADHNSHDSKTKIKS